MPPRLPGDRVGHRRARNDRTGGQQPDDGRPEPRTWTGDRPPIRPRCPVYGTRLRPHPPAGRAVGVDGAPW